ncbi:N-acetylmuramoyl-L-alanine amidase [Halobacillus sp. BBL2006]|uniref:N-acetylmuramoyl-L-alanine amidase n=1 Tax=Halobacillus sp. BBL2006 TaxID=1543706 RepID=UPI00054387BD|nr:N-acetylmuramoyl-L-alanine amidase [Halobacillus sp. BBL2006]KHE72643.1 hypothetical protein LD39_03495 [Halobacillus sp. BBL2006]
MFFQIIPFGNPRFIQLSVPIIIIFIFLSTSNIAFAHEKESYRVNVNSLNVRSEPNLQSSIIGSLSEQTIVNVDEMKNGWANVQYSDGNGWVASQYLYQTNNYHSSSKEVVVKVESAYIRSGPSINDQIIGGSFFGDSLQIIEEESKWLKVRLNSGEVGWIANWLVTKGSTTVSKTTSSELPLIGVNVVLDAGHGGYDPGAIGMNGLLEKHSTLHTIDRIAQRLRQAGATVILTRETDQYLSLQDRVQITRSYYTDAFISVHYNSASTPYAKGISTYYYHDSGKALATSIHHQLSQKVSLQNDGVQFGNFHVLRDNIKNSVLLELGFLSTSSDLAVIQSEGYANKVAKAISAGLISQYSN